MSSYLVLDMSVGSSVTQLLDWRLPPKVSVRYDVGDRYPLLICLFGPERLRVSVKWIAVKECGTCGVG